MSDYNAKNYTEQGGDVTHIGGKLIFEEGSFVEGLPSSFTPAENQADSEATTVAADLDACANGKIAVMFTVAYLYEHREEADHHAMDLTLRALLFGSRKEGF